MEPVMLGLALYGGWKLLDGYVLSKGKKSRRRKKAKSTRGRRR